MTERGGERKSSVSKEHWQKLFRFVYFRVDGDAHVAEDIIQETWLALARNPTAPKENLWAWLLGTARHLIHRSIRDRSRERRALQTRVHLNAVDSSWSSEEIDHEDTASAFYLTLSALSPEDQSLLIMKYRRGMSLNEMMTATQKTHEALRSALARARRKFVMQWETTIQVSVDEL